MYLLITAIITILFITIAIGAWCFHQNIGFKNFDKYKQGFRLFKKDIGETMLISFILSCAIIILFCTLLSLALVETSGFEDEYEINSTTPIVAFSTGSETVGRYIFGTGTTQNKIMYYYMEKTNMGNQIKSMPVDSSTYIVENNNIEPNITVKQKIKRLPDHLKKWGWRESIYESPITIITIPENSISYEYNVDLSNLNQTVR